MKIIEPSVELINAPDYKTLLTTIELAGRTCYKSEDKITNGSVEQEVLKWLSGEYMRQTLRNVPAVECGCRLRDTGVVRGRMQEKSQTTAHTAAGR